MSKHFLINGQVGPRDSEQQVADVKFELSYSMENNIESLEQIAASRSTPLKFTQLQERYGKARKLETTIRNFLSNVAAQNQPAQKLHDAIVSAMRRRSADGMLADLSITNGIPTIARDRRITLVYSRVSYYTSSHAFLDGSSSLDAMLIWVFEKQMEESSEETGTKPKGKSAEDLVDRLLRLQYFSSR